MAFIDNLSPNIISENRILIKNNVYMMLVFIVGNLWNENKVKQFDEKKLERAIKTYFEPLMVHIIQDFECEETILEDGLVIFGYLSEIMEGHFAEYWEDVWSWVNRN